jgi:hypothetical protein
MVIFSRCLMVPLYVYRYGNACTYRATITYLLNESLGQLRRCEFFRSMLPRLATGRPRWRNVSTSNGSASLLSDNPWDAIPAITPGLRFLNARIEILADAFGTGSACSHSLAR